MYTIYADNIAAKKHHIDTNAYAKKTALITTDTNIRIPNNLKLATVENNKGTAIIIA